MMTRGTLPAVLAAFALSATVTAGAMADSHPIRVGVPLPMTGPYAGDGVGYLRGIEMAVNEINEDGGLLGRLLEIVRFDTQDFAPELLMQAADQLVGADGVDVSHGGWAGWGQDVLAFGRYDAPFFMWDASELAIQEIRNAPGQHSNVFQLNDVERPMARIIFDVMAALPVEYPNRSVAIVTSDDSWGLEMGSGVRERAAEEGWNVVVDEVVPYGTREWGPVLSRIRAAEPGWVFVEIVSSPELITFFRQFMSQPTQSLINMSYGASLPDFVANIGAEGDGIMGITTGMPVPTGPTPEANAWIERFTAAYGEDPAAGSFAVYTGVMWWADAVRAVGDPSDYAAINEHLSNTAYETLAGTTWSFNEDNHTLIEDTLLSTLQVQDGRLVTTHLGMDSYDFEWRLPPWIGH